MKCESQQQGQRDWLSVLSETAGRPGGQSTGFGNLMQGLGAANAISKGFTGNSLWSNVANWFSAV